MQNNKEVLRLALKKAIFAIPDEQLISRDIIINAVESAIAAVPVSGAVDELPPLPQPGIGFPWRINGNDGVAYCAGFTAEQMREYAIAARAALQPAQTAHEEK